MYIPQAFAIDENEAFDLVDRYGFAHLVSQTASGLTATPLPLLIDRENRCLRGHLARANPHWRELDGVEALVILAGADGYVSPSWYPSKAVHGRVVPTWNYQVVHVSGVVSVHDDVAWLERLVRELTARNETGRQSPWSVDDAPTDFIERQLRAIVGIERAISRIDSKFKLSQNRSVEDIEGVVTGLQTGDEGSRQLAAATRHAADRSAPNDPQAAE